MILLDLSEADDRPMGGSRRGVEPAVTAEDGGDPGPQLLIKERLLHEVVGTAVEGADAVRGGAATGEDDHRQPRVEAGVDPVGLADRLQHVEAGGVGQAQI